MKVVCNREQLLKTFTIAASVAPAKSAKEIITNIKMVALGDSVCLQATNMEIWLSADAEGCEVQQSGEVLLPVTRAGQFLRESPEEQITIEAVGTEIHMRTKGGVIKLPSAEPKAFPARSPEIKGPHHVLSAKFLLEAIRRTAFATDPDSSRYALAGVMVEVNGDTVAVVGTDGRRLAYVSGSGTSVDGHSNAPLGSIVPASAARVLSRALGADGDVRIELTLNDVTIEAPGVTITARLVEGRYPNWRQVIPKVDQWTIDTAIPVGAFDSVVRQAAITADAESRGLEFRFEGGTLSASAQAQSIGLSNISMPVSHEGEPVSIKLDYRYLRDFLSALDPSENFELKLMDSSRAALLSADGYQYVVMPMALER